jgi:methyl-accepting chemotaxis protein
VQQAGGTMDEIVVGVRRVADLMREVTAASQDQTSGIEQVNQAVGQMDQVTQQNAALVEEATAAAQSLEHQAKSLLQTVNVFHFGAGGSKLLALS